jgi:methionine-R-sulfoxide reductase
MKYNKLTPEEEFIIINKGTEPPFSGEYDTQFKPGIYVCKRCNTPLYKSEAKFHSGCRIDPLVRPESGGWPSFDEEIPGAIKRIPDPDGIRTEIQCAKCGAHLGHVFTGERITPKNTRHCVNSLSLKFIPKNEEPTTEDTENTEKK